MKLLLLLLGLLGVWSAYGFYSSRVEQVEYVVTRTFPQYEVRTYPKHLVAQTTVTGDRNKALNDGFTIVAGYIFGGNTKKESIAMTAPVVLSDEKARSNTAESIAMTAPVMVSEEGNSRTVSFGMPKSYTKETLPVPTDSRVRIVEEKERTLAVLRFSGYRTESRIEKKKQELRSLIEKDAHTIIGTPLYAGYNAPFTPPWMTRNEVLIEIAPLK